MKVRVLAMMFLGLFLWAGERLEVQTKDGLLLALQPNGAFETLRAGATNLLPPGALSGIWIQDVQTGQAEQFLGHAELAQRGVLFTGYAKKAGLKVAVEFIPEAAAIRLKGYVENLTERERAVDLQVRVYCSARGVRWARDVQVSQPIGDKPPAPNTTYPFHGLGSFAMAVSPEEPAIFEFGYEGNAYYVLKLKYGLSQYARGRLFKRAHFQTLLYRTDPEWGFRSVVEKYYQLHEPWFHRRAIKNGMWLFYRPNAEEVPNPWDYAYHADTKEGWKEDTRHGVANLPYHLPGQREFTRLPKMPESYADQMKVLNEFDQEYSRHISPESIYEKKNLDRQLILDCGLHDGEGRLRAFTRETEWGGPSLTFILNPSPYLYDDRPDVTMGKVSLEWARWKLDHVPEIDGLMVDSLFGWGRYFNCRKEHFPYARISLTYDPESKQPAISNQFSHQEYLWELRDMLQPHGKLLMGNGLRPGRFFNAMELDVLTSENPVRSGLENPIMGADLVGGGDREQTGLVSDGFRNLIFARIASGQKPFLVVDHHAEDWNDIRTVEYFWKVGLFFGVYPGFNWRYQIDTAWYEKHKGIINHYLPLLKQISAAGWDPIPYAKSDNPNVWIERYGPFFTMMNVSASKQTATVSLQMKPLKLDAGFKCVELVRFDKSLVVAGNQIRCAFEGNEVKVVKVAQ